MFRNKRITVIETPKINGKKQISSHHVPAQKSKKSETLNKLERDKQLQRAKIINNSIVGESNRFADRIILSEAKKNEDNYETIADQAILHYFHESLGIDLTKLKLTDSYDEIAKKYITIGPQLITCKDPTNNDYIVSCFDTQTFETVRGYHDVNDLLTNTISLYEQESSQSSPFWAKAISPHAIKSQTEELLGGLFYDFHFAKLGDKCIGEHDVCGLTEHIVLVHATEKVETAQEIIESKRLINGHVTGAGKSSGIFATLMLGVSLESSRQHVIANSPSKPWVVTKGNMAPYTISTPDTTEEVSIEPIASVQNHKLKIHNIEAMISKIIPILSVVGILERKMLLQRFFLVGAAKGLSDEEVSKKGNVELIDFTYRAQLLQINTISKNTGVSAEIVKNRIHSQWVAWRGHVMAEAKKMDACLAFVDSKEKAIGLINATVKDENEQLQQLNKVHLNYSKTVNIIAGMKTNALANLAYGATHSYENVNRFKM